MPGERITRILLAKSDLRSHEIAAMSEAEAWRWLYTHFPPRTTRYRKHSHQICFTGFSIAERGRLEAEAGAAQLEIVKSVTKSLRYLVTGPNAGPAKLRKAKDQEVVLLTVDQFRVMLETGELPI